MLTFQLSATERVLLAQAQRQLAAGHTNHKGTPRENFISQFLETHFGAVAEFGNGEVIDTRSVVGEERPQCDIIISKRGWPRIPFSTDDKMAYYLAESVYAVVEIKSTLTSGEIKKSHNAARKIKALRRTDKAAFSSGFVPKAPAYYVVAYGCDYKLERVEKWLVNWAKKLDIEYPALPPTMKERSRIGSPSIDGVFILGKGFCHIWGGAVTLGDERLIGLPHNRDRVWFRQDMAEGALEMLFHYLTASIRGLETTTFDSFSYSRLAFHDPVLVERSAAIEQDIVSIERDIASKLRKS